MKPDWLFPNLKAQGFVLIAIPLISEILFVMVLFSTISDLEAANAREIHAKAVIALASELESDIIRNFRNVSGRISSLIENFSAPPVKAEWSDSKFNQLAQLVGDDPVSTQALSEASAARERYRQSIKPWSKFFHGGMTFLELREQKVPFREFINACNELSTVILDKLDVVVSQHEKLSEEATPKAAAKRRALRGILLAGLVGNVGIAILLAFYYSRWTLGRVDRLMRNISNYGSGNQPLVAIEGNDEIARLDSLFLRIAAQKLRAEELRREMMSMVSHDLRSPLTSISGYIKLLEKGVYGAFDDKVMRLFKNLFAELSRLIRLTNTLLDIEKLESSGLTLTIDEASAAQIIADSINALSGIAEDKQIRLTGSIPEDLQVKCDSERMVQVLVNLLSNALKYAPRESEITVAGSMRGASVVLAVTDRGPGIPKEQQALIFERFKQLEQPSQTKKLGAGLGLALCKEIVEKHGGTLEVISEPGQGATFEIVIPASPSVS